MAACREKNRKEYTGVGKEGFNSIWRFSTCKIEDERKDDEQVIKAGCWMGGSHFEKGAGFHLGGNTRDEKKEKKHWFRRMEKPIFERQAKRRGGVLSGHVGSKQGEGKVVLSAGVGFYDKEA